MKFRNLRFVPFDETLPGPVTEAEASADRLDQRKALYEFLRHLGTLSSAALVLIATLVEKVFPKPVAHGAWIGFAMIAFLVSLVAGGWAYLLLLGTHPRVGSLRPSKGDNTTTATSLAISLGGFLLGMGCVAVSFAMNWLGR